MVYTLEALTCCDDEFMEVVRACNLPYKENDPIPLIIEKIKNEKLSESFDSCVQKIYKKTEKLPKIRYPMFHGTNLEACESIMRNGFDASRSKTAVYNKGTYFSTDISYCTNGYAQNDKYGHQILLVCKVIEGRSCLGTIDGITDTNLYESARNSAGTILSTPYSAGAIPLYLVRWFRKFPTIKKSHFNSSF